MCSKMGGHLVEIETAAENALLRTTVDSLGRMLFQMLLCYIIKKCYQTKL